MASRNRGRRPPSFRKRVEDLRHDPRRLALVMAGVVVVLSALLFTWEAFRAVSSLQDADDRAGILQDNIVEGDVDAARRSLELLDEYTSRAHNSTNGPIWWLGAQVPILGRNVDAMRTVAREVDRVSDEVLPGIVDVADKVRLDTYRPKDGRINLVAVAEAAPIMVTADEVLSAASRDVGAFDPDGLVGPLREPMRRLQDRFESTAVAASAADDAAKLLPGMVGADGTKRKYLLMIMNNAEVRSLAGMPGSFAVLTAQGGKLKMGRQGGILDARPLDKPPRGSTLSKDEQLVFPEAIALDIRDTAIHPDFPRTAQLASAVVGKRWKTKFDGVIAVDPVTLGYMLGGLGPVDVGDGFTINLQNAVSTLLNRVYVKYPTDNLKHDDIFEAAARRIFDATVDGSGNSVAVIRALVRGVSERRLMLWSREGSEQKRIETSGIAGTFISDTGRPQVDVYVNDYGSAKMSYYLAMSTKVRSQQCLDGDTQELRVTTTVTSNAPPNASRLPLAVRGFGPFVHPGNLRVSVRAFGPLGGEITSMTVDGQRAPLGGAELNGRPFAKTARELGPGQNTVIMTTMRTAAASPGDPQLRTTPGILQNEDSVSPSACD